MMMSPWLRFLDETSKIVTGVVFLACVYTRSAGVIYFAGGTLVCSLSAKVIKYAIKQKRPANGRRTSYGMPSTHASACTFLAVSALLNSLYLPDSLPVFVLFVVVPWASAINISRVWLGYHTWPQVAGGVGFGLSFALLWFKLWVEDVGGIATLVLNVTSRHGL